MSGRSPGLAPFARGRIDLERALRYVPQVRFAQTHNQKENIE
jgi:hypothetical protein